MVSYASNVCGSISKDKEGIGEESEKPPEQAVGLDRRRFG